MRGVLLLLALCACRPSDPVLEGTGGGSIPCNFLLVPERLPVVADAPRCMDDAKSVVAVLRVPADGKPAFLNCRMPDGSDAWLETEGVEEYLCEKRSLMPKRETAEGLIVVCNELWLLIDERTPFSAVRSVLQLGARARSPEDWSDVGMWRYRFIARDAGVSFVEIPVDQVSLTGELDPATTCGPLRFKWADDELRVAWARGEEIRTREELVSLAAEESGQRFLVDVADDVPWGELIQWIARPPLLDNCEFTGIDRGD
jgi:hypothetical protein